MPPIPPATAIPLTLEQHTRAMADCRFLVLGIGNTLLTDEGIGVFVARALAEEGVPPGVAVVDGGTLSFTLAEVIADAEGLVVVDAAQLHDVPGTVKVFEQAEMDRFVRHGPKQSVHEVGLIDLLDIAALTGQLPVRRALVGIQAGTLDWGDAPTAEVQAAIPAACTQVREILERWLA